MEARIVRTAEGEMETMNATWFPSSVSKKIRLAIWHCCKQWIPNQLPAQTDVEIWHAIIWPECEKLTLDKVAELIEAKDTVDVLAEELDDCEVYEWLDEYYATLKLDQSAYQSVVNRRHILPNQNGSFKRKADLARDAGDIDVKLLDILEMLGNDVREQLLAVEIETELEDLHEVGESFVVIEIASTIETHINDRNAIKRLRPALSKLLMWFREDAHRARKLFPMLYDQKHLLYDDEEILDNIERAEELSELLNDYNVATVAELRAIFGNPTASPQLLPVTQQIIASLGITSVEEWTNALEDKDLAALFSHESVPTWDMFIMAQTLISKAKKRVIEHLTGLDNYDLSEMDETAITVLAGVKKGR